MNRVRQDTYYFPNTQAGKELRDILVNGFTAQGIAHELDDAGLITLARARKGELL